MSIVNAFLGCIGGFVLVGVNLLALALVFKGSAIAFLFLLFEVFGVTLGWKAIQALVRETCQPKPPPRDPSLPTFSEFHKQRKKVSGASSAFFLRCRPCAMDQFGS